MKQLLVIPIVLFLFSCSNDKVEMTELEQHYAELYRAESVSVTFNNVEKEEKQRLTNENEYYLIKIINSEVLDNTADEGGSFLEIAQFFVDFKRAANEEVLHEIEIEVSSKSGFFVFTNTTVHTMVFSPDMFD